MLGVRPTAALELRAATGARPARGARVVDGLRVRGLPPRVRGSSLAELLAAARPERVLLPAPDALLTDPDPALLAAVLPAMAALPGSVRVVRVADADFDLTSALGRAGWRLVLAGLCAHAQSRTTVNAPSSTVPVRASTSTAAATLPGEAFAARPGGRAPSQATRPGQRQPGLGTPPADPAQHGPVTGVRGAGQQLDERGQRGRQRLQGRGQIRVAGPGVGECLGSPRSVPLTLDEQRVRGVRGGT